MKTLICEICKEPIAKFNPAELNLPIDLQLFKSLYPERSVPDPFPPVLDRWEAAACPRCRRRPFFNHMQTEAGDYIISTGERVPEGEQWFVLTLGDSGEIEKLLLSPRQQQEVEPEALPQQDPPEQPPQEQPITVTTKETAFPDLGVTITTTTVGPIEDQEPTGNYKSPPVICPTCGKQFRSAGRMAKYHYPCPNLPPQEGFKV
jgi:hypothetical protein